MALPWFRARLTIGSRPRSSEGNRSRVASNPTLLYKAFDANGEPITLSSEDTVEVESAEYGSAVYRLAGEPQPMRKRRSVIGFEAPLKRVEQKQPVARPRVP